MSEPNVKIVKCAECDATITLESGDKIYDWGWEKVDGLPVCSTCLEDI